MLNIYFAYATDILNKTNNETGFDTNSRTERNTTSDADYDDEVMMMKEDDNMRSYHHPNVKR